MTKRLRWSLLGAAALAGVLLALPAAAQEECKACHEDQAKAFISSKGGDADFQPVALTDEAMDKLAAAIGCPVESITFDPYPT